MYKACLPIKTPHSCLRVPGIMVVYESKPAQRRDLVMKLMRLFDITGDPDRCRGLLDDEGCVMVHAFGTGDGMI